jgi:hypothetical protein
MIVKCAARIKRSLEITFLNTVVCVCCSFYRHLRTNFCSYFLPFSSFFITHGYIFIYGKIFWAVLLCDLAFAVFILSCASIIIPRNKRKISFSLLPHNFAQAFLWRSWEVKYFRDGK